MTESPPATAARRLNARIYGDGGDWLVLGHGFGTDQTVWAPLIARLADRFRILTFDLAYLSQVRQGLPIYADMTSYADDIMELLTEEAVENAVFVGHSVSAMLGLLSAVGEPGRIRRLVMLNASARYLDDIDYAGGLSWDALEAVLVQIGSDYREWVLGFAPAATGKRVGHGYSAFVQSLLSLRPDLTMAVLKAVYQSDFRALLPKAQCEVVVMQARDDVAVTPEAARYIADHCRRSSLVWLEAEGHLAHLTDPEGVLPAIEAAVLGARP